MQVHRLENVFNSNKMWDEFRWHDSFTCHSPAHFDTVSTRHSWYVIQCEYIQGVLGHVQRAVMAWLACFGGFYERQLLWASDGVIAWQRSILTVVYWNTSWGQEQWPNGLREVVCVWLCQALQIRPLHFWGHKLINVLKGYFRHFRHCSDVIHLLAELAEKTLRVDG